MTKLKGFKSEDTIASLRDGNYNEIRLRVYRANEGSIRSLIAHLRATIDRSTDLIRMNEYGDFDVEKDAFSTLMDPCRGRRVPKPKDEIERSKRMGMLSYLFYDEKKVLQLFYLDRFHPLVEDALLRPMTAERRAELEAKIESEEICKIDKKRIRAKLEQEEEMKELKPDVNFAFPYGVVFRALVPAGYLSPLKRCKEIASGEVVLWEGKYMGPELEEVGVGFSPETVKVSSDVERGGKSYGGVGFQSVGEEGVQEKVIIPSHIMSVRFGRHPREEKPVVFTPYEREAVEGAGKRPIDEWENVVRVEIVQSEEGFLFPKDLILTHLLTYKDVPCVLYHLPKGHFYGNTID